MTTPKEVVSSFAMATFSLPSGRSIEITATVNAAILQQVEILGPGLDLKWEGVGEGKRIGQDAVLFPVGLPETKVEVRVTHSVNGDGIWSPSHETVTEERTAGEVRVTAEDGRGTLDANDLIVRFRWVV